MKRIALVLLILFPSSLMAEIRYAIMPLTKEDMGYGFDLDFALSGAVGINNSGEVAISGWHAVLRYSDRRGLEDLGNPAIFIQPTGINDHGQVVAFAAGGAGYIGFRYTDRQGWEQLDDINGHDYWALGINNKGQIVGTIDLQRIFRYTDHQGIEEFGPMQPDSIGAAINDHGWITGWNWPHAILYSPQFGLTNFALGMGKAINNRGAIAGKLLSGELFLYQNGEIRKLGTSRELQVRGINDRNEVVGCCVSYYNDNDDWDPQPVGAFIWSEAEGGVYLSTLIDPASGWVLWEATGINNAGQICGNGIYNGQYLPFRLDPIT